MPCGGSIGDGYGPLLVGARAASRPRSVGAPRGGRAGHADHRLPGAAALRAGGGDARRPLRPDPRRGARGPRRRRARSSTRASSRSAGTACTRWRTSAPGGRRRPGLPLPLGGNAVRRDLGRGPDARGSRASCARPCATRSTHRAEALAYAMSFARGMDPRIADRFVGMWVNEMTLDCGERGPARGAGAARPWPRRRRHPAGGARRVRGGLRWRSASSRPARSRICPCPTSRARSGRS